MVCNTLSKVFLMTTSNQLSIYIHWPFCKSKCPYCDFYKEIAPNINQDIIIDEYISSLEKYHKLTNERIIKSIFFGGGTPSLIRPQNIERIINFITKKWKIDADIEISLEANPNSEYSSMFSDLKNAGINRLSLGVQALNEQDLKFLGRTHNLSTARNCIKKITNIYDNHSVDLIYARPNQKLNEWENELQEITSYGLKHISLYQLTIEENTVFAKKNIKPLDEDSSIDFYKFTKSYLYEKKYNMYEVSNFSLSNYQSKHNLTYWQGGDYIGIGKSAHGRLKINNQHFATQYPFIHEKLTPSERAEELIIMGLRLSCGINKQSFKQICTIDIHDIINQNKLSTLKELNLINEDETHLYATDEGFLLLNKIIEELCC